jgi:methionyl aminopeptidase
MTFTIEPMVNLGSFEVTTSTLDNWTVTTKDRSLSAQWDQTILLVNIVKVLDCLPLLKRT